MSNLTARFGYRPVRIGWVVADGDVAALRRAWPMTHTLWGGRYNPVIPVVGSDEVEARQLIAAFGVDCLFPLSDDASVQSLVKEFAHLAWLGGFRPPTLSVNIGQTKVSEFLDVYHAIMTLAEREEVRRDSHWPQTVCWIPKADDPLQDLLAATYGLYATPRGSGRDYLRLLKDHLGASNVLLQELFPFPAAGPGLRTPNRITTVDLEPDRSLGTFKRPGFYVGSAASFSDLVNFWNLRAAGIDLYFFDPVHADRLAEVRRRVQYGWSDIEVHDSDKPTLNAWHAGTLARSEIEAIAGTTSVHVVSGDSWRALRPPQMQWRPYTHTGIAVETAPRTSAIPLQRKPFNEESAGQEKVGFTVEFLPGPGEGEFSYRLPNLPRLAPLLTTHEYLEETIRLGPRGTTYVIPASAEVLHVRGWDAVSLLRAVFQTAGIVATPSPAGKRATRLIHQMGGLLECEVFKIAGVRALLKKYAASQDFGGQEALKLIGSSFATYEDLGWIPRSSEKLEPSDVFNHTVERGVFRIGLRLVCDHCGLPFWTSLDEAKDRTDCEFCGNSFHIARQLGGKNPWRYRRSGLFGADDTQQGAIPVALTLHRLYTTLRAATESLWIAYTTGMDLEGPAVGVARCESDLVVLTQTREGDVSVLVGECKTASRIERDDVEKLDAVARALEEAGLKPYILFTKLAAFSSDEIETIRLLDRPGPPRLILLTHREIEPAYLYERTEQEYDLQNRDVDFSGLAEATRDAFLSPRILPPAPGE